MKKYRFRLEAVLRVRRLEEDRAAAELAVAYRAVAEADAELERRLDHYRTVVTPDGALSQERYLAARSQQDTSAAAVVTAGTVRLAAEAEAERKRAIWAAAATRVRALERLDERRREEHLAAVRHDEVVELDEISAAGRQRVSR